MKTRALPGWAMPVSFALVTAILFRDFIFSDRMLVGQDTLSLGYAARAFFRESLRTSGFPLWNPQLLGGTPFLESLAGGDSLYPPSFILLFLTDTYRALGWKLVLHVFLAGCFMHLWIRRLGGSRGAALVGGLVYLLGPYTVSLVYPGHDGKLFVSALTPLLFFTCEWMMSRRDLLPGAALSGVVALVILTTHFQMAYFLFGAVGAYMVFRSIQVSWEGAGWQGGAQRLMTFLAFSVLGAGAAGVQLVPAVAYVTEYSRRTMTTTTSDKEDALAYGSSWSLHQEEAVGLVVPEFVGNSAGGAAWAAGTYWGRNPFKTNHEYLGLVALLLAAVSFMGKRRTARHWFLVTLGAAAFLFALGAHTPIWRLAYELFPGISLFRAPSMAIFLTGFSVATLAGLGLDRGLEMAAQGKGSAILTRLFFPLGLLVVGWVLAQTGMLWDIWITVTSPALTETSAAALQAAQPHAARGFLLASLFWAGGCALFWAMDRRLIGGPVVVAAFALLVIVDEGRVDKAFIQTIEFESFAAPDGNATFLMDRAAGEEPFRVLSLARAGQDVAPAMHGLELAGGHHPNDLARYRELIGMAGSGLPEYLAPPFNANVMRLLNIRYILWPDVDYGPLDRFVSPGLVTPVSQLQYSDGTLYSSVYEYPGLPRARVVGDALVVPEDEVLGVILDESAFDPETQTVLTESPPISLGGAGVQGEVTWIERSPNRLVFDVDASGSALVVLSDNWFPAWKALVDGIESPVLRADHTLRAVAVTGGRHRVEFRYESTLLRYSLLLSIVSTILMLGVAGRAVFRSRGGWSGPLAPSSG